jgi:hypothetical protein
MDRLFIGMAVFFLSMTAIGEPVVEDSECKYKKVAASTTDDSGGITVPNGETWALYKLQLNGADPSAYVAIIWDYNGGSEKIYQSTKGDVLNYFNIFVNEYQVTGDGTKQFKIIIINDNTTETPIIGGCMEFVKL